MNLVSASPRLPTVIVTGADSALRAQATRQWLNGRPDGEHWLRLLSGRVLGTVPAPSALRPPRLTEAGLGALCACCVAGPVLATQISRLLTRERPDGLLIDVPTVAGAAEGAHVERLIDRLAAAPLDARLALGPLIHVVADASALPVAPAHAGEIWLPASPGRWPALSDRPWPLRYQPASGGTGFMRWRADDLRDDALAVVFRWPARPAPGQAAVDTLLEALGADPDVAGLVALIRTPRAWYRWRRGGRTPGSSAAEFGADVGSKLQCDETGWRSDNRIVLWRRPGLAPSWLDDRPSVADRLAALHPDGDPRL